MIAKSSTGRCKPALRFEVAAKGVGRGVVHVRRRRVVRLSCFGHRLLRDHAAQLAELGFPARNHADLLLAVGDRAAQVAQQRQLQDAEVGDHALR